jgi:hypothetical protein
MRYAAWLIAATGCAEVIDLPDQLLGYEDLSPRMCGCDFFRLQTDVAAEGTKSGDARCDAGLGSREDKDAVLLSAVEAGCSQCGDDEAWGATCYEIAGGRALGETCESPLDCASFACELTGLQRGSQCKTGNLVCEKEEGRCVASCTGCASPPDDLTPICLGSIDVLLSADCMIVVPLDPSIAQIYDAFRDVAGECEQAGTVCETHPSRPVLP